MKKEEAIRKGMDFFTDLHEFFQKKKAIWMLIRIMSRPLGNLCHSN